MYRYELKNFRGDVRQVINDVKSRIDNNSDNLADYYQANVIQSTDSYPFGWDIKERSFSIDNYRFGFNGMEKDQNIGEGNYTTFHRILDTRIGRWLSVDPEAAHFTSETPYSLSLNNPIAMSDPNGDCPTGDCDDETTPTGGNISIPSGSVTGRASYEGAEGSVISFKSGEGEFYWNANDGNYQSSSGVAYSESSFVFPSMGNSRVARATARRANILKQSGVSIEITGDDQSGFEINPSGDGVGGREYFLPQAYPDMSTGERFVPVWGTGRQALHDFQDGYYWSGSLNTILTVSDFFIVKGVSQELARIGVSAVNGGGIKGIRSYYGIGLSARNKPYSMTYSAVSARWKKLGLTNSPFNILGLNNHKHHWLIANGMTKGNSFLAKIGNQAWNMRSFRTDAYHKWSAHWTGTVPAMKHFWHPRYQIFATPGWIKGVPTSILGRQAGGRR